MKSLFKFLFLAFALIIGVSSCTEATVHEKTESHEGKACCKSKKKECCAADNSEVAIDCKAGESCDGDCKNCSAECKEKCKKKKEKEADEAENSQEL